MARSFEEALRLGEAAYAEGEFEDALRYADEALDLDTSSFDGLDLRANALAELGEWEEADEAFARLIERAPSNPALLLAAADVKVRQPGDDRDRLHEGLALLDRAWPTAKRDEQLSIEAELLRGVAKNQLGECELALESLLKVLDLDPDHAEARLEAGIARFELGRFEEAAASFKRVAADYPEEPWAHHYLGLIAERTGDDPSPFFKKARHLAPDDFPAPAHLESDQFDQAVADAIAALPAHAKPHLANVIINVEQLPSDEEIRDGLSPAILGVFHGTPVDERSVLDPADHQTARITLFQLNLERFATTRDELIEEISVTVLHEVGHLLGLDEDELYERGLD